MFSLGKTITHYFFVICYVSLKSYELNRLGYKNAKKVKINEKGENKLDYLINNTGRK